MVSLIQSNYRGLGSGMTPDGCGFILQDRGELFSLEGRPRQRLRAAASGRSTPSFPAFVTKDGKPWLSFGVMGGDMQPQGHVQILVNLIDFGMNLQEAGDAPRARHDGSSEPTDEVMRDGGEVVLEVGASPATVKALEARGHKVKVANDGDFGGYQAIMRNARACISAPPSPARTAPRRVIEPKPCRGNLSALRCNSRVLAPVVR